MADPSGSPYILPQRRMDAIKKNARRFFALAYATQPSTAQRREAFHLGWTFDAAVVAALLIAMAGSIMA